MSPRERFNAIMNRQTPDRALIDLYGCPQTMICDDSVTEEIKKLLGLQGNQKDGGFIDERILRRFDVDFRMTGGFPMPKSPHAKTSATGFVDPWGIEYSMIDGHYEISRNPLCNMEFEDIRNYHFPTADDIDQNLFAEYAQHAKRLYEQTDYIVCAQHPVYGVLETGCWMFGFDDFLYRLAGEKETVHWFFQKIFDYQKQVIERYYTTLGKYIHLTTSGDDFGTQRGMFMSVEMFREMVAPYFKDRITYTKSLTNAYFQHHSCGSIFELIPTLIDCGVDVLNPIQPGAYLMEPERLQQTYGDKMVFWGGIDTQHLLVHGTPDEVKAEVKRILKIFTPSGRYILSPAHCIQNDVPAANVIAIYQAAKEFYSPRFG